MDPIGAITVLLLTFGGKHQPVFNAARPFEDVGIGRGAVAFAENICGAELEGGWESGSTCPLHAMTNLSAIVPHNYTLGRFSNAKRNKECGEHSLFLIVVTPHILTTHNIDIVKTQCTAADAF
jgi:hypothetical protein